MKIFLFIKMLFLTSFSLMVVIPVEILFFLAAMVRLKNPLNSDSYIEIGKKIENTNKLDQKRTYKVKGAFAITRIIIILLFKDAEVLEDTYKGVFINSIIEYKNKQY